MPWMTRSASARSSTPQSRTGRHGRSRKPAPPPGCVIGHRSPRSSCGTTCSTVPQSACWDCRGVGSLASRVSSVRECAFAAEAQRVGPWTGRLFWGPGRLVYIGLGGPAERHRHHAVQLVVSFGEPFEISLDGPPITARAAVVPSGARHTVETSGRRVALILMEPAGPAGAGMAKRSQELSGRDIASLIDMENEPGDDARAVLAFADRLAGSLDPSNRQGLPLSPPVSAALDYLDGAIRGSPRLAEAARAGHISPSRLTHLFSDEVGIPFRRFVLWLRLRRAAEGAGNATTLTEAAIAAGLATCPTSAVCVATRSG